MTIITACVRNGVGALAADTNATGSFKAQYGPKGIQVRDDFAVGFSGSLWPMQWFNRHRAELEALPPAEPDGTFREALEDLWLRYVREQMDMGSGEVHDREKMVLGWGVLVTPGHIYSLESNGCVCEPAAEYHASGSGEGVAMGAMWACVDLDRSKRETHPGIIARIGVKAAIDHAPGCGGPWQRWNVGEKHD
jgi:ATP-dependent protease HslVU (ClpYQ) peptidase subunit